VTLDALENQILECGSASQQRRFGPASSGNADNEQRNGNYRMRIFNIEATDMGSDQQEIAAWVMQKTTGHGFARESQFDEFGWIEKACKALGWQSVPEHGGLIVEWAGDFMNPATGSVDTYSNWVAESADWEGDVQAQLDSLVEVVKDANGDWVEV
jgi:hypothetical protein